MNYYVLDGRGEAVSVGDDALRWARWLEEDPAREIVEQTAVGDADVSTVFLGIDHQWGDGPPLIFETMVFGGKHDQYQRRWSTRAQAVAGHDQAVASLRRGTLED